LSLQLKLDPRVGLKRCVHTLAPVGEGKFSVLKP
jgi:hypothetical protein